MRILSTHMGIKRFLKAICYEGEEKGFIGNCGIVQLAYVDGHFTVIQFVNFEEEK